MNKDECFREPDILEAVRAGEWPGRAEPALREHVESCAVCAEVLAVALAFQMDAEDVSGVRIPTAAHVWWRAGIRARQEAVQAAERPMAIVGWVAAASAVGLASAAIGAGWVAVSSGWPGALSAVSAPTIAFTVAGAAAALLLIPLAVYFAMSEPKS